MADKSLVILQPNSKSNPSDKFRLADFDEWLDYHNGDSNEYNYVEYDTYEEAQDERKRFWESQMEDDDLE